MRKRSLNFRLVLSLMIVGPTMFVGLSARAMPLECPLLPQLFQFYFKHHYSQKQMTDEIQSRTVDQYIKIIDPSKSMLLQSDIATLKQSLLSAIKSLKEGNCGPIVSVKNLLLARAVEDEAWAREILGDKFKIDENIELNLDIEKRGFPATSADRKDLVRKLLHFQVQTFLLTDIKMPEIKKQLIHRYELATKRVKERSNEDFLEYFGEAFAQALDPHSSYLSQDSLEDFQIDMNLSLEGIGASLTSQDGFTVIEELIPGGGAEKSKTLMPKDKIIAVAQDGHKPVQVIDMELKKVVRMIRGKKGTKVTLTILRQAENTKSFDVTIVRDKIDIKEQAAKITYETKKVGDKSYKIGIIELPSFYGGERGGRTAATDIKNLLIEAKREKVSGIIFNLSKNGGGLLEDAVKIAGYFIKRGGVVATKESEGRVQVLSDDDDEVLFNGPMVVLISRLSASASEIVAGALKDYKRALIVGGDHTYGKGSVQILSRLPLELGAMKVTTGLFFLPGGNSTQHRGVSADIRLPSIFSSDDVGEKTMDYSLPPQTIPGFLSGDANAQEAYLKWQPVTPDLVEKLSAKSKERVAKDPKFSETLKAIEERNQNKGIVKLSALKKKAEEETKGKKKKAVETTAERKQRAKDQEAPYLQESVNIILDMLSMS